MLGSNPSADSVASTDTGGCYGVPLSLSGQLNSISGAAPKRKILGVWGQSPHMHRLPTQTALSWAPSHNAWFGDGATIDVFQISGIPLLYSVRNA